MRVELKSTRTQIWTDLDFKIKSAWNRRKIMSRQLNAHNDTSYTNIKQKIHKVPTSNIDHDLISYCDYS